MKLLTIRMYGLSPRHVWHKIGNSFMKQRKMNTVNNFQINRHQYCRYNAIYLPHLPNFVDYTYLMFWKSPFRIFLISQDFH